MDNPTANIRKAIRKSDHLQVIIKYAFISHIEEDEGENQEDDERGEREGQKQESEQGSGGERTNEPGQTLLEREYHILNGLQHLAGEIPVVLDFLYAHDQCGRWDCMVLQDTGLNFEEIRKITSNDPTYPKFCMTMMSRLVRTLRI